MTIQITGVLRRRATALTVIAGWSLALAGEPVMAADGSSRVLEEIVVTATKRESSLQDVPISVGVVTGEFMNTFNIQDMSDVQNYVPGLQVQQTFGSWAVRIRGLGSGITNLAFDSSVPIYIDDVYCGRGKCMEGAFLDMERLEVARGPRARCLARAPLPVPSTPSVPGPRTSSKHSSAPAPSWPMAAISPVATSAVP
jgi:iron complex outermembrane receptor protein